MSENQPVVLEGIPVFTGDLAVLDTKVTALGKDGEKISTATADIHSSFGGLQAFYKAPEADQLFATTKPVADRGASLKSDLTTITGALSTYSDEAFPLVKKLERLKDEARTFLGKVKADDKWREDGDLVEENNNRRAEIAETWAAFQAVERACHNKIIALVPDGKPLKTDDGSGGEGMYGYDAEALKHAKGLPWGDPVEESKPWYHLHEHGWDFLKGVFVDGVWGTIKGLGTLVGTDGWESMKQAWTGLAKLATGVAISSTPLAVAFWTTPEEKLPSWLRDSRTAMKETGKALLAWDQWSENPSRAAGAVTFNVVTTVFTGGTGGAVAGGGKAALAAKALSFAGKAGRAIDPMTYLFKGAGAGLTKISDVMAGLKGMGNIEVPSLPDHIYTLPEGGVRLGDGTVRLPAGTQLPDGAIRLPDGAVKLPEGIVALPEGTVRNPSDLGAPYLSRDGHLYNADGSIAQHADQAPRSAETHTPDIERPVEAPALVSAGGRSGGEHLGDTVPGGSGASDGVAHNLPSTHPRDPHYGPSAGHEQPRSYGDGSTGQPGGPHGGHHEGPAGSGYDRDSLGQNNTSGSGRGDTGADGWDRPGSRIGDSGGPHGWEPRRSESAPLVRDGEVERQVREQLRSSKVKRDDLEKVLANLADHPAGGEIADTITSGRFKGAENFDQVISSLSHPDKMSGGIEQIRLANRLHESGIRDISFEVKGHVEIKPGVMTGELTDLDVMARDSGGNVHGYQFKDIQNPKKVIGKIFANMKQLDQSGADFKTFVIDTKGTLADHASLRTQQRLTDVYGETQVQFIIRVEDGVITIPPGGTFMPEAAL
ncbi:hypothetical protein [Streptomyces sp. DvalAA-19]|uniref:hypothetical protein n=1 Tax=Streptomyces sp. DvalAA-19 TaxID=1839761 RepID=UPI00081B9B46|nr:hypothetical protein [Streptomyces sp. DvalAA-19]SCD45627.1 hypothetical protein GA0115244_104118 [Streptomyces sp. DvalAA-19]